MEVEDGAGNEHVWKLAKTDACCLLPEVIPAGAQSCLKVADGEEKNTNKPVFTENIHPSLAMYHCDGRASLNVSWTQLQHLLHPDQEDAFYRFLTDNGLIAAYQQCEFCGARMSRVRENGRLLWMFVV